MLKNKHIFKQQCRLLHYFVSCLRFRFRNSDFFFQTSHQLSPFKGLFFKITHSLVVSVFPLSSAFGQRWIESEKEWYQMILQRKEKLKKKKKRKRKEMSHNYETIPIALVKELGNWLILRQKKKKNPCWNCKHQIFTLHRLFCFMNPPFSKGRVPYLYLDGKSQDLLREKQKRKSLRRIKGATCNQLLYSRAEHHCQHKYLSFNSTPQKRNPG